MGKTYGGIKMDSYVVPILLASLVCALLGGVLSRRAMKTGKFVTLAFSVVFAVLCLVGIIISVILIFFK
jgi:hypothetical protein